ncbi:MAG: threonine ammonia-lyase [Oscillospiraceae bacterium]|nr:threonine ammonia-lyase [Oscillospiraceae bacterium]
MLTLDMVYDAQKKLKEVARLTPLNPAPAIGENVFIKSENLQLTGSFKLRGAFNKISSLTDEEKSRGVIACSAGNHAQGVALSATKNGIKSVICMPAGAPLAKVEATKGFGAEVVLVDGVYDDAAREAERLTKEKGYTFAHPFNDEYVIAGQGTIALEILEQLPDVEQVVVPIGGGGLISGVAYTIKQLKPDCKVIGVQAATVPSMYESWKAGKIVTVPDGNTIADGIHVLTPGNLTFELVEKYVDEVVTVSEDEICAAILTLLEKSKTVAEGAGATPVAACLYNKVDMTKKTVCVVSGGNVDVTTLNRIITKGMIKTGRIVEVQTKVGDKPGQLNRLLQLIAENGANIMSIVHKREDKAADVNTCVVSLVLETRNAEHVKKLHDSMIAAGYELL